MATLVIKVWNVYLFRKDGEYVDQTQVDEKDENLSTDLFYDEFEIEKKEGDYITWDEDCERISPEAYKAAGLSNEIIKTLEE